MVEPAGSLPKLSPHIYKKEEPKRNPSIIGFSKIKSFGYTFIIPFIAVKVLSINHEL